jgi:hypothetical protein
VWSRFESGKGVNELEEYNEKDKQRPRYSKREWNTEPNLYCTDVQIYTITPAIKQQTWLANKTNLGVMFDGNI